LQARAPGAAPQAAAAAPLTYPGRVSTSEAVAQSRNAQLPPQLATFTRSLPPGTVRTEFEAMNTAIRGGNYEDALRHLGAANEATPSAYETLRATRGLGDDAANMLNQAGPVARQLSVARDMQAAGFPANMPPSGPQVERYFQSFNPRATPPGNPDNALGAFQDYTSAFHVHAADLGRGTGINYANGRAETAHSTGGASRPPRDWNEVQPNSPGAGQRPNPTGLHAGQTANDCEGYAFMAQRLLGSAGFQGRVVNAVNPGQSGNEINSHVMTSMVGPPPGNRPVVTSNNQVYTLAQREEDGIMGENLNPREPLPRYGETERQQWQNGVNVATSGSHGLAPNPTFSGSAGSANLRQANEYLLGQAYRSVQGAQNGAHFYGAATAEASANSVRDAAAARNPSLGEYDFRLP